MKYFYLILCIAIKGIIYSQPYMHDAQNIEGKNIPLLDTSKALVVCYNSGLCSACFQALCDYCNDITQKHPHIQFIVLIKGDDIVSRRTNTSSMRKYFEHSLPKIVYDLHPAIKKRYCVKFKIQDFPALLLFDKQQKNPQYISYKKLFGNDDFSYITISKETEKKINLFILSYSEIAMPTKK
jgi:hypothetical protein